MLNPDIQWSAKQWKRVAVAAFIVAVGLLAALAFVLIMGIRIVRVTDKRLIGTWQSDAERTIAEMTASRSIDEQKQEALRNFFGKMRITFTPTTYTTELNGTSTSYKYEVLGKDKHSVIIHEINRQPSIMDELGLSEFTLILFENPDCYRVNIADGGDQEYFKRVQ